MVAAPTMAFAPLENYMPTVLEERRSAVSEPSEIIRPYEFLPADPKSIKRPCDYSLEIAWSNLEIQLGTIEAYNRLCAFAALVRADIEDGKAKAQNSLYRTDTGAIK